MSQKQINIKANLDDSQLRKQLSELEKEKHKINIDVDKGNIDGTEQSIKRLSTTAKNTSSVFGKLKSAISNTFSTSRLTMAGFLLALNEINKAGKNAKQTIDDMDKSVTNLATAMGQGRNAATEYLKSLNSQAQELGATTKETANSADSWIRQGKSVAETEKLIYDTMILSKLGKIESADATTYLTAALNGYQLGAEKAIDVVDKLTAVDIESASEAGGLAESLSKTSSAAKMAGISFDRLIGMIATVKEVTQDSDESVGNMFKSVFSRMNQIKAGKFIDLETGESLNDTEKVLTQLGISMRDTNNEFISSEKILDEVGSKWQTFDSTTQRAIATAMAGTYQYNRLLTLFDNYGNALKYTEVSANSAGSAVEKFNSAYKESLESKRNTLQASFESMVINSDFDEVYSGILDATNALVDFINESNALKGIFTGLTIAGGVKSFLAIKTGINEAYISLNQFQNALNIAKQTTISTNDFDKLLLLSNNLSQSQMKLLLSSKNLSNVQREQMLVNSGLSVEEAKLQLETWGLTTANNGLTVATTTLKNAALGLWNTLLANPITIIITAISAATMAYNSYKQKVEETRQANIKASDSAIDMANELKNLYVEYAKLNSIQDRTSSEEDEYKGIIEDITVALGARADALKGLTQGTEEYTQKLQELTQEELKNQHTSAVVGRKSAEDTLKDTIWSDASGSTISIDSNSQGKKLSDEATKAVEVVSDALKDFETINRTWNNISWDITTNDPDEAVVYYNALLSARENLVTASKDNEALLDTQIYRDINSAINTMSGDLDTYISKKYEELKLDYLIQNTIPTTAEEYQKMEDAISNATGANGELQTAFRDLLAEDFSGLYAKVQEGLQSENILSDIEVFSISDTIDLLNTQLKPTFEALKSSYQDIFTEDGFTLDNVNLDMISDITSVMEEMKEAGLNVDTTAFENLATVLGDTSSQSWEVQEAFNNVASSAVNSLKPSLSQVSGEQYLLIQSMLESLGVMNSEEAMISTLGYSYAEYVAAKEEAAQAGKNLANLTEDEISKFTMEQIASDNCGEALAILQLKKLLVNDTQINATSDIQQILGLAKAAGITSSSLTSLANAKAQFDLAVASGDKQGMALAARAINDAGQSTKDELLNYQLPEIDFNGNVGSAGKAGKESADEYLKNFEQELSKLDTLRDQGKISEKNYLDSLRKLYLKFFHQKEKYISEMEKYEYEYLSGLRTLYEKTFSYITSQIDKRIDSLNDEKDTIVSNYEKERDARLEAIELQQEQYEKEIDAIEDQIDAKEKEIDALKEANEERQNQIDLQEKIYNLERAQNQRDSYVYKDGQMSYVTDTSEIRDARKEVEDAKYEISLSKMEKEVDLLEEQKDAYQEKIDLLEEQADAINDYYDKLIENTEKHYEAMTKGLEETKNKFSELSEVFENAEMGRTLEELDINMEALLNGSTEEFDKLKTAYVGILADMSRGNDGVINQLSQLAGVNAESVSYLESTKGAFENLGATTIDPLSTSVEETATATEGLSTSASEASTAVGDIGTNASNTTASITPLNEELQKLKDLLDELTTLFNTLEFPTPGDEGYAQKLDAIATAFGNIATKCKEFEQINFSSIIGTGGEDFQGTGFTGLGTAISNAVKTIDLQMDSLKTALQTGNDAFDTQIKKISNEYVPAWENLQTRLAEIIGVGGGGASEDGATTKTKTTTETDTEGGSGSIVDIMQTGGDEVSAKLQDPWLTSFNEFATGENSIESIAQLIKDIVTEMATSIQSQCESAAKAIKDLADTALNSSISIGGHGSGSSKPSNAKAYAKGSDGLPRDEKNALVGEVAPELVVDPETGQYSIFTTPTITDLNKGTIVYDGEDTKKILSGKGDVSGNAYAEGTTITRSVPVGWVDEGMAYYLKFKEQVEHPKFAPIDYTAPGNENLRKFKEYMERNSEVMMDLKNVIDHPFKDIADSITKISNSVVNNSNNQTVSPTFNITMPNVTNSTAAETLANDLQSLVTKKYQYFTQR